MCALKPAARPLPLAVALALCPARLFAQTAATEDNPLLGTWTLLVEKSRYNPGPPPQRQTRTNEAAPHGVKTTIRTVTPTVNRRSSIRRTTTASTTTSAVGNGTRHRAHEVDAAPPRPR